METGSSSINQEVTEFENHIVLTREIRQELALANHTGIRKTFPFFLSMLFIIEGLYFIFSASNTAFAGIICIAFGIIMLFMGKIGYKFSSLFTNQKVNPERVIRFTSTMIFLRALDSDAYREFSYDEVKKIAESKNLYILSMKNNEFVVINKNGFTKGDRDSFITFIESKCQKVMSDSSKEL